MLKPALFLDRDGVVNVDHGYVHLPEKIEFVEGIFDLVKFANDLNHLVVIVTNQAGIGRGFYTESQFSVLTQWMRERFLEKNARIDRVYFCPNHPEHGIGKYRQESEFRKPNPGMLLQAAREMDIDLSKSLLVGDKMSDMIAAASAEVPVRFLYCSNDICVNALAINRLSEVTQFLMNREHEDTGLQSSP